MSDLTNKVNTCDTQALCHDCKRPWDRCRNTHVFPLPIWDEGSVATEITDRIKVIAWICEDCRDKRLEARTYYCYKHAKSHTKSECDKCVWCPVADDGISGHFSSLVPSDAYVDFRGWRFTAPFICMGCGIEVCIHQWCFSRSCGSCDLSVSKTRRVMFHQCFAGPREKLPTWRRGVKSHGDIPESHFIEPARREEFPLMYPQLMRWHDDLDRVKRERYDNPSSRRRVRR